MTFTPAMEAAAGAASVLQFFALELLLPGEANAVRLLDSAHAGLTFAGRTFVGRHATYGAWVVPGALRSGITGDAEHIQFALLPPDANAGALLAAAGNQGAPVTIWRGILIPSTGAVVADPVVIWTGVIDVPVLKVGDGGVRVDIDCATAEEVYFETDEALGLNDASHRAIRPGELGFAFVTGLGDKIYWGTIDPDLRSSVINNPSVPVGIRGIWGALTNRNQ